MRVWFVVFHVSASCGVSNDPIECVDNATCNLDVRGTCLAAPTGHRWCRYPAPTTACPTGYKWSPQAGDGLANQCVDPDSDAGFDARLDVPFDAGVTPSSDVRTADAFTPDANGFPVLTVRKSSAGSGKGVITSNPSGIDCEADCDAASFGFQGTVTLEAKAASGSFFMGWSGSCEGLYRYCTVSVDQPSTVFARFDTVEHNLVFVSSTETNGNIGGLDAADQTCNDLAGVAGLSGHFIALLSSGTTNALDRLVVTGSTPSTPARGFVRMDGLPVVDEKTDFLVDPKLFYPLQFDENGQTVPTAAHAWTGLAGADCMEWTSPTSSDLGGEALTRHGPKTWLSYQSVGCNNKRRLYCVMVDFATQVAVPQVSGRRIWISDTTFASPASGNAAYDACASSRPETVFSSEPLLSTTQAAASMWLVPSVRYVRPDGVLVGTGQDLIDVSRGVKQYLQSGIWQQGNGTYVTFSGDSYVWNGSMTVDSIGTVESTCDNWTTSSYLKPIYGTQVDYSGWWGYYTGGTGFRLCTTPSPVYCVEYF